jgi:nucleoside-diphosphate-sugar epimerase
VSVEKTILLTGASGFVGQHLSRILTRDGYAVVAVDQRLEPVEIPGVETRCVDLADPVSLATLPRRWWGVIHLAGASVPSHFATSAPVVSNLQITLNLLEHLEEARVLLVSSCHVYAPADTPRREGDLVLPHAATDSPSISASSSCLTTSRSWISASPGPSTISGRGCVRS